MREDKRDTIKKLQEKVELYRKGMEELNLASDALLIGLANKYGRKNKDGTVSVILDTVDIKKLISEYTYTIKPFGKKRKIVVKKREPI